MRRKGYPIHRPIVARLISHRDLEYVLEMRKLKGKPFGINQQSPLEVENKRKQLYPVMKKARDNGHFTRMVRDTLYIVHKYKVYTPQNDVTEGTHVKEVAVEEQLCTPQNPLRIDKPVNVQGSVLPQIYIIRKN